MSATRIARTAFFSSCCLISALLGTSTASSGGAVDSPQALLALEKLQSDFHGASTLADADLMRSLWADDAVFHGPTGPIVGPDAITSFFTSGPRWGKVASLAPTYKTWFEIHGNRAEGQFECILVETVGSNPLTTSLSTIPFGNQNPTVEIVQHSTASVTAAKERGRWVLKTFQGSAGPIP